jgi:sodium/bile acid cotransporter 7
MAALIFGNNPGLGLILLPIMIYHPLQLIVCSIMAENYSNRLKSGVLSGDEEATSPA